MDNHYSRSGNGKAWWFGRSETLDLLLLVQFLKWALILINKLPAASGVCFIKLSHWLFCFFKLVSLLTCALLSRIAPGLCGWGRRGEGEGEEGGKGKGNAELAADSSRAGPAEAAPCQGWLQLPMGLCLCYPPPDTAAEQRCSQLCAACRPQESSRLTEGRL